MIVTRSWLNEWIDLEGISTEDLCKTFNAIGLEVDRVESYQVPEKIVIGHVVECEKHPEADKLSICKVDIGTSIRQIVCGASNVRQGLSVAVATVGAEMPGGLKIKPVKLRGVDSEGMICSSTEIGLPKAGEGIMELDASVGDLEPGKPLTENEYFNDDLIEIELTANRGDCLSIRGVARDLSAAFNRPLKSVNFDEEGEHRVGIGRILQLSHEDAPNVNLRYRAIDMKSLQLPLLMELRLAQVEEERPTCIESMLLYATHSTGVILRAYHYGMFAEEGSSKAKIMAKYDENGYAAIFGKERASILGVRQEDSSRITYDEGTVLIEASYIPPDVISKKMAETKIENGPLFYRTSRGSEPQLDIGLDYGLAMIEQYSESAIFGGSIEMCDTYENDVVGINLDEINAFIGAEVDRTTITQILKNLGFNIEKSKNESFVIGVPRYRHDIANKQDIVEEIVRLVGIDNIASKPFSFAEENRIEEDYTTYKKRRVYRHRAAQTGFFESVHFVFNEREQLEKYGFTCIDKSLELLNPIVNTLDTLRPTLLVGLLNSASQNAKMGRKQIPIFEVGNVFDTKRNESLRLGMVFSGDNESESISNAGKPQPVTFETFVRRVSDVIGDFTLKPVKTAHSLAHPFQAAAVYFGETCVGELFKVHPNVQEEFDLQDTFLCEVDFAALPYALTEAEPFSKFQASYRDLSVVMPSEMAYSQIADVIEANKNSEIIRYYPVDRYQDESLGEQVSLTLRFVLQSPEKTLEEEDITSAMSGVLGALESELGLALR
jgi:phenylalanyl-tRNA synthetase beta chain